MDNPFEVIHQKLNKIEILLTELKQQNESTVTATEEKEGTIDVEQAAVVLNITVPYLYVLTSKKKVPHMKKGRKLYFFRSELIEYLESGKQKTVNDIQAKVEKHLGELGDKKSRSL
jgi:excisionase family DNA binding protein